MVAPSEESEQAQQAAASAGAAGSGQAGTAFARIADDLRKAGAEFTEYGRYLLSLYVDQGKLLAKRAVFIAIAAILGCVAVVSLVSAGAVMLIIGVTGLIGTALNNFWMGATIVGVLTILALTLGSYLAWIIMHRLAYRSLRRKYAQQRGRHKSAFGRDIQEVAHAG